MPLAPPVVETERLLLRAATAAGLDAILARDAVRARQMTGGLLFPDDVSLPPLIGEDLPQFRERLAAAPRDVGWWVWLVSLRADRRVIGMASFAGPPNDSGAVQLGYSVYPECEGNGYATEMARGLVGWAFQHPTVKRVRATIPPSHLASQRVAAKAGFVPIGDSVDAAVGRVLVFAVDRL